MTLIIVSFISGVLTVLAPCVLPIIPVILGSSATTNNKRRSKVIILSLAVSIFVFTIILKATTILINIDPKFWSYLSGVIITIFGFITLFPELWDKVSLKLGLSATSSNLLNDSAKKQGIFGDILIGAALGPVFSSCSPTYSLIIATILPVSFGLGLIYLFSYTFGLMLVLMLIAQLGQRFISSVKWAIDPHGIFKKILGGVLIITGVVIITGFDKKIQIYLLDNDFFDVTKLEQRILDITDGNSIRNSISSGTSEDGSTLLNVSSPFPAPEIVGISDWLNSDQQKISDLKGKVVVVDFWTYSCINCVRTLPYLKMWHEKYADKGLVILGIHSPEFSFERDIKNVRMFVEENGIKYPVGLDNDFQTWRAYSNRYWPAKYFIDKNGYIRHFHFGEGAYKESEEVIQFLLSEGNPNIDFSEVSTNTEEAEFTNNQQTPETYLGYNRQENFMNKGELVRDNTHEYTRAATLPENYWTLEGLWEITDENIISKGIDSKLILNFSAKDVYLVMGPEGDRSTKLVKLILNGEKVTQGNGGGSSVNQEGDVIVDMHTLYTLISLTAFNREQVLEIAVPTGTILNAFTFGSK